MGWIRIRSNTNATFVIDTSQVTHVRSMGPDTTAVFFGSNEPLALPLSLDQTLGMLGWHVVQDYAALQGRGAVPASETAFACPPSPQG